jgi:transcriptional regulator with XRE-family HTH domain
MERTGNKSSQVASRVLGELNARGYSQRWLAEQTTIPLATLNRRIQGRTSFTLEELYQIASALEVSVVELILPRVAA